MPETVTAEQIMARMEEIAVTDRERAEIINKRNLAGNMDEFDDIVEYDKDLYLNNNIFSSVSTNIWNIIYGHSNQTSR